MFHWRKVILKILQKGKKLSTQRGTNTAVRRLMTWHIQRYGKPLNLSTVTKQTANSILKHFFLEVRDTRKGKEGEEYEPGTLTTYRNGLRRYFLERPKSEGERFDIGEDEDLKNKLSSKRKQLKSVGKGNRPNACDLLDEEQIEKLWSSRSNWFRKASATAKPGVVEQHSYVGNASHEIAPRL